VDVEAISRTAQDLRRSPRHHRAQGGEETLAGYARELEISTRSSRTRPPAQAQLSERAGNRETPGRGVRPRPDERVPGEHDPRSRTPLNGILRDRRRCACRRGGWTAEQRE
jgi:hypothetical protein